MLTEADARRCFSKKDALKDFSTFAGKCLCQSLFLNKVAGRPAILLKKWLWRRYLPVNFAKFLRTPFLQNTSGSCFYANKGGRETALSCLVIPFQF